MSFYVQCSNCGHRSRVFDLSRFPMTDPAEEIVKAGWDSFGSACYCQKCVKSWEDRNGKDRPLWGMEATKEQIYKNIIREQITEIEYLKELKESAEKAAAKYNPYWRYST